MNHKVPEKLVGIGATYRLKIVGVISPVVTDKSNPQVQFPGC